MAVKSDDEFWRKIVNNLKEFDLSVNGKEAPTMEKTPASKGLKKSDGSRQVVVQKVVTKIYVFTDLDGKAYTSMVSQDLAVLGKMTLEEGLILAQEDKRGAIDG